MNTKFDAFRYINNTYDLAAKKGARVEYTGDHKTKFGVITGVEGAHLMIRLDGEKHAYPYHPTWELRLLEPTP